MAITIKLEKELDDEFVSDVLIVAFDGDVGACWNYGWFEPHYVTSETASATWLEVLKDEDGIAMQPNVWTGVWIEQGEGYDTGISTLDNVVREGIRVDANVVRIGIQRILDGTEGCPPPKSAVYAAILEAVATEDCGSIDADAADCIIQAGVYGEVVFS